MAVIYIARLFLDNVLYHNVEIGDDELKITLGKSNLWYLKVYLDWL